MRIADRRITWTLVAFAGCAALLASAFADATTDVIKSMRDLEKAGDESQCVAKIVELKDSEDPRVLTVMREFVHSKSDKIACAAMKWIAEKRDSEFWKWLVPKIDEKELFRRKDGRPEIYKAVLECVATYLADNQDRGVLKPLDEVVKRFLATDAEYASRAIRAYGTVRDPAVVEQLLDWLDAVDAHGQSQSGKNESAEARKQKDENKKALLETLNKLVGPDLPDAATWRKFWDEHKKGFVFPDPHRKESDEDVTKLAEWTDPAYGWHVKRPDGPLWKFMGKDAWYRIQLTEIDDKNIWWCFAAFGLYKLDSKVKDVKSFAEWWMNEEYGKNAADGKEFSEYAPGGEPKSEDRKIAGRDWTVVTVKGKTKDKMANWGIVEKRIYITKLDYQLFYANGTVRSGAEPEDKKKLWDFIEGVTFGK